MKPSSFLQLLLSCFVFVWVCAGTVDTAAENTNQELQRKIEELSKKAEQTSDPAALMKIMQELQSIMQQMPAPGSGMATEMPARGETPEEEVDRAVEAINRGYRDLMRNIQRISPEEERLVPISFATRLTGHVAVTGKDSDAPQNGWIPLNLSYQVLEEFVGYLVITDYYNPKARRFVADRREYMLASISTGIRVPSQTGRQCTNTDFAPFVQCTEWRTLDTYDINSGDVYPAIHDWVIMGSTEEGKVTIEVESPSIYFRSSDRKAGRGIGCYGTKFEQSVSEFSDDLPEHTIKLQKPVGTTSAITPRCEIGSRIELEMEVCDPKRFADLDRCKQTEMLMGSLKMLLTVRNAFKEMAAGAKDVDHLLDLVSLEIRTEYPGVDLQNEAWLEKNSGSTNLCDQSMTVPDLCKGCTPRPLCEWLREGLQIHEQAHYNDLQSHPNVRKLFCDDLYQMQYYSEVNKRHQVQAKTYAKMDYDAYTQQANYLRGVIEDLLSANSECQFEPKFFVDFQEAIDDLEHGRFK